MVTEIDPKRRNKLGGLVENFQNAIFSTDLKGLNGTQNLFNRPNEITKFNRMRLPNSTE